jgi:hypothetical protein
MMDLKKQRGNKPMAKKSNTVYIVLAVVVVGFVFMNGGFGPAMSKVKGWFGSDDIPTVQTPTGPAVPVNTCDSTTTPQLDINSYDLESPGTALTESSNIYRRKGDTSWTNFVAGTPFDVIVGAQYEILMGSNRTDEVDNSYGSVFTTDAIPCRESVSKDVGVYQDSDETATTGTFYNADSDAGSESFVIGQTQDVSFKFETPSKQVFGNPNIKTSGISGGQRAEFPNVFCINLNSTSWDAPEKVSVDGTDMQRVATPLRHTLASQAVSYCYEAPVINDNSASIKVRLNADDTNAPVVTNHTVNPAVDSARLYAATFYVNADTSKVAWGVEDEDGTAVGTDAGVTVDMEIA